MTEHLPYVVMLLGGTTIAAIMAHAICRWLRIPGLVGYILIGVALAVIDGHGQLMTAKTDVVFEFLGGIGIVALLFRGLGWKVILRRWSGSSDARSGSGSAMLG